MSIFRKIFYSPSENHLGVLYSKWLERERFVKFVTHNQWSIMLPSWFVRKEINLNPRTAHIHLKNVFAQDSVPLDVELKIFYRVDPREAQSENHLQVLGLSKDAFDTITKTNIQERARNEVFIQYTSQSLFTHSGRQNLRRALSSAISSRVRGLGVLINPLYGVSIVNLQPNPIYLKALQDQSAAYAISEASVLRIVPMLKQMKGVEAQDIFQLLAASIASAVNKTGDVPEFISSNEINSRQFDTELLRNRSSMHQPSSLPEDFIPIDNAFVAKQREPEFHSR
ncbi:MAG: hypothetical protein HN390_00860 [Anaerolineae bacterium]|nr:hypothetical protein [Anaerolineae bacterium]MBT7989675.1 hypothetical protein [Anaerolineae bacterium]